MEEKKTLPKNRKRNIMIVIIVALILILAIVLGIFLWQSHIRQLSDDMHAHLENSITFIEQGQNELALAEAVEASELAKRLRDDDALIVIQSQTKLVEDIIRGIELFSDGEFLSARESFESALDSATRVDALDTDFIEEHIYITDGHIYFFKMLDSALSLFEQANLEEAIVVYEGALLLAASLSFPEGEALALEGIYDTTQRIIQRKRASAAAFVSLGEWSLSNSFYTNAIENFQNALEIYEELSDPENIESVLAKIALAEYRVEEARLAQERLAQERLEQERLEQERLEQERLEQELLAEQEHQNAAAQAAEESSVAQENPPGGTGGRFDVNYAHNRSIDFDLTTLIDNQNQSPANLILMGTTPGLNEGWYNGCGWISAYNALIILGNPVHPAEIVNHFEVNRGAVMGGILGTFPHAIERFFVDMNYDVTHTLFPQVSANLDEIIRASRVSILAYSHTRAAHFIAIEYREDLGVFIVYNDSFARRRNATHNFGNHTDVGTSIDSINSLIRYTPEILFSFSLITIN